MRLWALDLLHATLSEVLLYSSCTWWTRTELIHPNFLLCFTEINTRGTDKDDEVKVTQRCRASKTEPSLDYFLGSHSSKCTLKTEMATVTRGTMVKEVGGWVILSTRPNSIHMSIKALDGWRADSLIYGALKSDTRSMGCSCGKSGLSPAAVNHWARVDQLHEVILRHTRLFSSASQHKKRK